MSNFKFSKPLSKHFASNLQSGDTPLVLLCPAWKSQGISDFDPENPIRPRLFNRVLADPAVGGIHRTDDAQRAVRTSDRPATTTPVGAGDDVVAVAQCRDACGADCVSGVVPD